MIGRIAHTEFTASFPDEAACVAFLEKARWPDGKIISPASGGEAYRIATRLGLYKCKSTRQTFTVRQGTIFEESRLPLKKWFFTVFLLTSSDPGISSVQLAKHLGVTQKTAWFMLQRLRYGVEHSAFRAPLRRSSEVKEALTANTKKSTAKTTIA